MPDDGLLLGIDVGTTHAKVGVFALDGALRAAAAERYPPALDGSAGAAEQNPDHWWQSLQRALHRALAEIDVSRLLAVSVGGQGPTLVALDQQLRLVCTALTWLDTRAVREWQTLCERAATPVASHAYLPKAMWLKRTQPAQYDAVQYFCQAWDFIAIRLIEQPIVTTSAGIAPWNDALIRAADLDAGKFLPLRPMGEQVGRVTAAAAEMTGLPAGLPVVGGISDYFEGLIGSGTLRRGIACDNGGTSQSFNVCWDAQLEVDGIFCLPSFVDGCWYIGGPASTTGKSLDWWREQILQDSSDDWSLLEVVRDVAPGSEQLLFLPYLAGERAPLWDPHARGVFFGLSLDHTRAHLTRAILESVAYVLRHLIERIEAAGGTVDEIHACGGQARSETWCRIKADVTGRPVFVPAVTDAATMGAAIIAGVGAGVFDDYATGADRMVRTRAVIEPDPAHNARYSALFDIYRDIYTAVRPAYARLQQVP